MEWSDLQTTLAVLAWLLGGLFLLDKAIDMFKKYKKPADDIAETVRKHGDLLAEDNRRISALEGTIKEQSKVTNKAILQIMNHQIDGNHTEQLKAARDDLQEYLISH